MRLTTRRTMLIVALIAAGFACVRGCLFVLEEIGEPYGRVIETTQSWNLGPAPTVAVDNFAGRIDVLPARDGAVTARIIRIASGANHQANADQAVQTIAVLSEQTGDTLRIVTRDGARSADCGQQTDVTLWVPPETRLDLHAEAGDINVGYDSRTVSVARQPVVGPTIRARNDAIRQGGTSEATIRVAVVAASPTAPPSRLQLDSAGRIEVDADRATIDARAWPAIIPPGWMRGTSQDGQQGSILIRGHLVGANSLRAAHGIELHLPPEAACQVEAEAHGGAIRGNAVPGASAPPGGVARWVGSVGPTPTTAALDLRTDEGPILIDRQL